jgi:hypothetical protein
MSTVAVDTADVFGEIFERLKSSFGQGHPLDARTAILPSAIRFGFICHVAGMIYTAYQKKLVIYS